MIIILYLNKNCYYNVCIGNVIDKELSKLLISIWNIRFKKVMLKANLGK